MREPTLPPQFFPIPDSVSGRARQRESELPRQHAHLSAMMHVMRNHVGKHGGAGQGNGSRNQSTLLDSSRARRCIHGSPGRCRPRTPGAEDPGYRALPQGLGMPCSCMPVHHTTVPRISFECASCAFSLSQLSFSLTAITGEGSNNV